MEPRKRFRAEISDKPILATLTKRRSSNENKQATEIDDKRNTIPHIPSQMLAKNKLQTPKLKEYSKPENWIMPKKGVKRSREQVFKEEKDNIMKGLNHQQSYSRAHNCLNSAYNPIKRTILDVEDLEDELQFTPHPSKKLGPVERKNYSKEFLRTFFDRANSIAQTESKKRKHPKAIIKRGKFASGLEPGAQEIVL